MRVVCVGACACVGVFVGIVSVSFFLPRAQGHFGEGRRSRLPRNSGARGRRHARLTPDYSASARAFASQSGRRRRRLCCDFVLVLRWLCPRRQRLPTPAPGSRRLNRSRRFLVDTLLRTTAGSGEGARGRGRRFRSPRSRSQNRPTARRDKPAFSTRSRARMQADADQAPREAPRDARARPRATAGAW